MIAKKDIGRTRGSPFDVWAVGFESDRTWLSMCAYFDENTPLGYHLCEDDRDNPHGVGRIAFISEDGHYFATLIRDLRSGVYILKINRYQEPLTDWMRAVGLL